ncbi:FAD-dependent 5-carboxymethylaminomethyl-2-thiouridine(34) oxidoreductase MnmC [Leucothrix arctica]|uniref:FAD dependent oxidoreductase domain-containing protein n=1 Tax=Leucothrix arctica TaxID=1481894 RepID=A0A317CKM1_9GAMM|nr:FAD-dependent 5-carboxymethylaminomethyl-2-thiouridine(34) oxidoreductase MnmC [Leucothrix arctica]PWQ97993.1 hypothetical protein DKT75_05120 [Leucothrix arctica]
MSPWFKYPTFDWKTRKAVVIGAGIAGCQMTYQLSNQGWHVTLIEQESEISQHASGNLAGVISPKMTSQPSISEGFYRDAFEYTLKQLDNLISSETPLDWYPCGMLQLNHNDSERQRWAELKARDFPQNFLQFLEQADTEHVAGIPCDYSSSYFPSAGFINPKSFCDALLANSNYELLNNTEVGEVYFTDSTWHVKDLQGQLLTSSEVIVVCTGKELAALPQSQHLQHTPVLGQTSLATVTEESEKLNCVICHEGYLTPRYDNKHVFGATFDRNFESISLTDEATTRNENQLKQYLSKWQQSLKHIENGHAAIRTTTPDRFPYVGGLPNCEFYQKSYESLKHGRVKEFFPDASYHQGLFMLGGLGARGLTTSGYCAQLLSDLISNEKPDAMLSTMHPARYLIRQLRRGRSIT